MGIALVAPGRAMLAVHGRTVLWRPLRDATSGGGSGGGTFTGPHPNAIAGLSGWWDAGTFDGLLDASARPLPAWDVAPSGTVATVADKSGNSNALAAYRVTGSTSPQATPRLNGLLGGVGLNTVVPPNGLPQAGYCLPQLDPDQGFRLASADLGSGSGWTCYLVWSRPNWRQGLSGPITLLSAGGTTILQADGVRGAGNRLMLFSGSAMRVLTSSLERRHTHSVIIRNTPGSGVDVWLDGNQVASGAANSLPGSAPGALFVLHSGVSQGGAQCWFHEAASWPRALSSSDITTLLACGSRWQRGARKGVQLLVVGQSNAGNALNDGAWHLMAQGVAWHLGALAYGVIGQYAGSPTTCIGGHGIYDVRQPPNTGASYLPGDFIHNPGDGSDPASYALGADGGAVKAYLAQQQAEDLADIGAILWPWSETDSTRAYSEKVFFQDGAQNLLARLRTMLGRDASSLPLIWWNAMPFWTDPGVQMLREVATAMAADATQHVVIGWPMTADVDPRDGDNDHIAKTDNIILGQRAAPVIARAILATAGGDSIAQVPASVPTAGGPHIVHAYRQDATHVVLTVHHDAGDDVLLPGTAASGTGFAVMDGGSVASPGPLRHATACARIDGTHLLLTLDGALTNASASCQLFYPYGSTRIGHGNAVTDNVAAKAKLAGCDIGADLGTAWRLSFPLAATTTPIVLSDSPN
jgi:hypothetical protein